ncbi:DegT/DnrJ/EryC1/StrS family aminotransferase [uncultured Sphingomonas sp.]|uniref:DegT/DnrJ/EryC1/StrS family aminotransferase n=1 Tax=uncultured Sphingomonas sp. TaxID=158754 RepID=UPI0035CC9930
MPPLPLIAARPPRLSELGDALRRVERSGIFSNHGPEVRAFEAEATTQLYGGVGASLAVANCTLGLMIALKDAAPRGGLCIMPALTFAATAQAALWAGLTPLIVDIDADGWAADAAAEAAALQAHGDRVTALLPYAAFGDAIALDRYRDWAGRRGIGVVIDAAASLGTLNADGNGFGADAPFAVVGSMHATKTFAIGEGGLVHSGDAALIARLRAMANFGFEGGRSATLPGLNAKLPEVLAVAARAKLAELDAVANARAAIEAAYREALDGFELQRVHGVRRARQFMPVLLPPHLACRRAAITAALAAEGVGSGQYFSPHLGEQPYIRAQALIEPTPVADAVAARILSLPVTDAMTPADAHRAAETLRRACAAADRRPRAIVRPPALPIANVAIVGAGPAGTALLTAAAKHGRLETLADGLLLVERDAGVGSGRLGGYAITSDSTADTFLSAVRDNPHAELAALADHPAARAVAAHAGRLGVPLPQVGVLLRETGERLANLARARGAEVLTGTEALVARLGHDGLWTLRLRRLADSTIIERRTRALVIATGGGQPLERLAVQQVAGAPLIALTQGRLLQSDGVLARGGAAQVADLLAGKRSPRIAVVGGSTSALTTVALLLKGEPALPLGAGAITLLHRRPLRPFYPSAEAALAEGFTDWGPDDVCPVSGFIYRLAGFRLEARELVLRMLGVDGRAPDPRVALHRLTGDDDATARAILREADLVIAALGYRPVALPLADATGRRLRLAADDGAPLVDRHCRIVAADDTPVPNAYGIGLAAGFVPWGRLGGEASFAGQANGLWLWQNDVGMMIVDQLLCGAERVAA